MSSMLQQKQSKYQNYSQCLQVIKQLPQQIENLFNSSKNKQQSDLTHLKHLVKCSKKFRQLISKQANCKEIGNSQILKRFFSRLRQLTCLLLTDIISKQKFVAKNSTSISQQLNRTFYFSKQLMIKINKASQKYQPNCDSIFILQEISKIFIKKTMQLAQIKQIEEEKMKQLKEQMMQKEERSYNTQQIYSPYYLKKYQNTSITQPVQQKLHKQNGLDIILNLEPNYMEKLKNTQQSEILKQALYRNRFISSLINKFASKFAIWKNKPEHKKNRTQPEYKPTVFICLQSPTKKKTPSKNPRPYRLQITNRTINTYKAADKDLISEPTEDAVKEDILAYINHFRQKYCLKKVIVLGNNLQMGPKDVIMPQKGIHIKKAKETRRIKEPKRSHSFRMQTSQNHYREENSRESTQRKKTFRGYYKHFKKFESFNTVSLFNSTLI